MKFMLIAGESSGDILAAELVDQLRRQSTDANPKAAPQFFGAGGPRMATAGVHLHLDLTRHAVVGLIEVLKNYRKFKRLFDDLLRLAASEQPDVVILVDFSGFNRRFAHGLRKIQTAGWRPSIVQYVSPQVWASRESRADKMARDIDLLLTIFPFEKDWYARRTPDLPVSFVGHPILDRYRSTPPPPHAERPQHPPLLLLLPGSRAGELQRHLPVMLPAAEQIRKVHPVALRMVLPSEKLLALAAPHGKRVANLDVRVGGLAESLSEATVAIASTGTVTMECAYFGVPTVSLYKTSWSTYQIGRRIIRVPYLAMPNLLANQPVFPELIQHDATSEKIARETLKLLDNPASRAAVHQQLRSIIQSLGGPGASQRAAAEILALSVRRSRQ